MKQLLIAGLLTITAVAQAQTTVPIVWPFATSSTQGVMVREILQEANLLQKKYQFVFEHKPGGGGSVAVNHALSNRGPVVLAHTNSYFIRPIISQEGSYDTNLLDMVVAFCENQPLAVIAKNYSNLSDLERKHNLTVGVIHGSITQLVSQELARVHNKIQFTEVGFKGTPEITLSVLGDHIDLSVDFLASINDDRIRILGITGVNSVGPHRTFRSQGVAGFDHLTNSYYLFLPRTVDTRVASEIIPILATASQSARVQELCRRDFGIPANIVGSAIQRLARERKDFWTRQAGTGIQR